MVKASKAELGGDAANNPSQSLRMPQLHLQSTRLSVAIPICPIISTRLSTAVKSPEMSLENLIPTDSTSSRRGTSAVVQIQARISIYYVSILCSLVWFCAAMCLQTLVNIFFLRWKIQ